MIEHRPNEIARGFDGGLHGYDAPKPEQQFNGRHFAERFAEILERLASEQEVVAFDKRPPSVIPRTLREVAEAARELQREMKCDYDPRAMAGLPIGQFHCPKCGEMVIAGMPH